jgi:UDP-N-acetyl-D-glucosamine dehydrogenase
LPDKALGIVGLGYVGLPLALAFAEAGNEVVGLDTDPAKLADLAAGRSYIEDVDDAALAALAPRLHPTADYADLEDCAAVIVCVPTPLSNSREPDLSYLREAAAQVAAHLQPAQLIVLESTSYPGTTREELLPSLAAYGGAVGVDFFLAFSPERIDPGRSDHTIRTTPKLVGGITAACTERARDLYAQICDTVEVLSSPETAELAKLLENIFRSVNIALVNEIAQLCDRLGIDVWEVVDAAATKPFGFMRFDPGPGMGGHCLPVDPFYLAFKAREHDFYPEFVELAGKVNQAQPEFCVRRIERLLNEAGKPVNGSRILILGASYKPGIGDTRESPALRIMTLLCDLGAELSYHDPFVPELPAQGLTSVDLPAALATTDLLAIVTAHPGVDHAAAIAAVPQAIDFRGISRNFDADNVERL